MAEDQADNSMASILAEDSVPTTESEETEDAPTETEAKAEDEESDFKLPDESDNADEGEDEDTLPDFDDDPELKAHPELKDLWDRKKKGVEKLVARNKAMAEKLGPVATYVDPFYDPEQWEDALAHLETQLRAMHGKPKATTESTATANDDYEAAGFLSRQEYELDQRLKRLEAKEQAEKEQERVVHAAKSATYAVRQQYGDWVTDDLMIEAAKRYPTLKPIEAFNACHAKLIAQKAADYGKRLSTKPKREMLVGAGHRESSRQPGTGTTMWEILQEEDLL